MTQQEQGRVQLLTRVHQGVLSAKTAAELASLSLRHVRRLLMRWRQQGLAALAHGNRGRPSLRRLASPLRTRILTLARTRYAGVNDHQFTELLAEREGIHVSRRTVQRLLRAAGLGSPRTRRPPRHRRRREPMPQAGLLIQMDGSHHPWLEDRGPQLVLHAALDDATGRVLGGVFRDEEDAHGYLRLLRHLIRRYGRPLAAYTDRHGIFHRDPRTPLTLTEQLQGRPASTQVGRALHDLGIRWIGARSPQAKGRIERLFGTFQDRLVTELRLAQARTRPQAQRVLERFLPRFNARFAHAPAHPQPAWRPAPAAAADLDRICSFKYVRTVQHDNTVPLDGRLLQLRPGPQGRSYAGARVDVHAHLDGTLAVYYRGLRLRAVSLPSPAPARARPGPVRSASTRTPRPSAGASSIPSAYHPWRQPGAGARRLQARAQHGDSFTDPLG